MDTHDQQERRSQPPRQPHDDEISLVDLVLVLIRRKWWIIGITVVSVAAGIAYSGTQQAEIRYTTTIELARLGDGNLVESPESVRAQMREAVLPTVRREMRESQDDPAFRVPGADAGIPDGGQAAGLIQITSVGPEHREELIHALHAQLVEQIKAPHDRVIGQEREELVREQREVRESFEEDLERLRLQRWSREAEIENVRGEMAQLEEQREHLQRQRERVDSRREWLEEQLEAAQGRMDELLDRQSGAGDPAPVPQSQIELLDQRIMDLHQRLQIEIPESEDEIELALRDTARRMETQRLRLSELEIRLEHLEATRARLEDRFQRRIDVLDDRIGRLRTTEARVLAMPMESVGGNRRLIAVLSLILGLMLGVFAAFFREFATHVRTALDQAE